MVNLQPGAKYKFVNAKANNVADLSGGDNKSSEPSDLRIRYRWILHRPTTVIGYSDHGGANQTVRVSFDL